MVNMMYCPGPSLLDFVSAKARGAEAADSKPKRVTGPRTVGMLRKETAPAGSGARAEAREGARGIEPTFK